MAPELVTPDYSTSAVGKEERSLGPGDAAHIASNTEHEAWAVDGEAEILSCKDVVTG